MTACIIGTVLEVFTNAITVEDRLTKQHYKCEVEGDDIFSLNVSDQGVFVGQVIENTLRVKKIEVRKFLDPLYEIDLFDASGKFSFVPVINDPFTSTFIEMMEKQKEIDALEEAGEVLDAVDTELNDKA